MPTAPLLLGIANCQSYDGNVSTQAWQERGRLMARQGRNVWVVTETTARGRGLLLAALGPAWRTWTLRGRSVAVLFNSAVFDYRRIRDWIAPGSAFGHGAVAVPLVHRLTGVGVDVIACHVRPSSIANAAQKASDVLKAAGLAGTWPAVIAGDFNLNAPKLPVGWTRRTPKVDTLDKPGVQSLDAAFSRGPVKMIASHPVIDPGSLSDHKWLSVDLAVTGQAVR